MQSPTDLSETLAPRAPPVPTFTTLPFDIRLLIAEKVGEERYEVEGDLEKEWACPTPTMRSVALVCRELADAIQPFLWQVMVLVQPVEWLVFFVDAVLPRQGHHIRSIVVSQSDDDPSSGEVRSPVLARSIGLMPNLARVVYDVSCQPGGYHYKIAPSPPINILGTCHPEDAISMALITHGNNLKDLTLFGGDDGLFDERDVAAFLSYFPSLRRFTATAVIQAETPSPGFLLLTLLSLRHLQHLILRLKDFAHEAFASAAWDCPLETLALDVIPFFSLPACTTFLTHFSSTLTTLYLNTVTLTSGTDSILSTPQFLPFPVPHLHTLALATSLPDPFLAAFTLCPLRYLTIEECPLISLTAWAALITSRAATLRRVVIGESATNLSSQEIKSLRALCKSHGVEFRFQDVPAGDGDGD